MNVLFLSDIFKDILKDIFKDGLSDIFKRYFKDACSPFPSLLPRAESDLAEVITAADREVSSFVLLLLLLLMNELVNQYPCHGRFFLNII